MGLWQDRLLLAAITAVTVLSLILLVYVVVHGRG
jgi:hypothetical protein